MRLRSHSESASTRNSSTSTPKALSKQTSRHSRQRVVGGKHVYVRVELDEKSAGRSRAQRRGIRALPGAVVKTTPQVLRGGHGATTLRVAGAASRGRGGPRSRWRIGARWKVRGRPQEEAISQLPCPERRR